MRKFSIDNAGAAERLEASVSIATSGIIWYVRYLVATSTKSYVVLVDAWHALIDALSSIIVFIASKVADRPADEDHPYGHGRALSIGTLLIGVLIVMIGASLLYGAVKRLLEGTVLMIENIHVTVLLILLTVLPKFGLWIWAWKLGVKYKSKLCLADAKHHLADALATIGVIMSLVATYVIGCPLIDLISAMILCSYIVVEGAKIFHESTLTLLDRCVPTLAHHVKQIAQSVQGVREVVNVKVRDYGRYYIAELDVVVDPSLTLEEAHNISHEVEEKIKHSIPEIRSVHTHITPSREYCEKNRRDTSKTTHSRDTRLYRTVRGNC